LKIVCSQRELQAALIAASKALPAKAQTPILNGIYIATVDNMVEIHATDFSTGIVAKISADIESEGATVINGKSITEIVGKLSGNIVTISTEEEEGMATFKCDATTFSIFTIDGDAEDFPKVTMQDYHNSFFIKNENLKRLITHSTFACADEKDGRPVFQGCSITVVDDKITFVATNTHRLVVVKDKIEYGIVGEAKMIVPASALNDVLGILNATSEDTGVKVDFSDKNIAFTINNIFMNCRLIDGTFPPHEKVIPASCETFAILDISEFASAINRVEIISKQSENNTVKLKFDSEGLELSATSYETGRVVEHITAEVEGPDIEIAFNLRYIREFLRISASHSEVRIGMNDSLSPADFRIPIDDSFIYIVTPVRTQ